MSDRASSAETSDQLGPRLEIQLIGGRSLGAYRGKASLRPSDDGRHLAFGRDGDRHQERRYWIESCARRSRGIGTLEAIWGT